MSISHMFDTESYVIDPNSTQTLVNSISYAWQCGASIIVCPWGVSSTSPGQNPMLENSIMDALDYGRCGLGCVVVFSSGNANSAPPSSCQVYYPQNSIDEIVVVGAINRYGDRWVGQPMSPCHQESSYGTELDVVAPGELIYTTDLTGSAGVNPNGDYFDNYGETSAASAHVAGVAALILSKNPCLTHEDVVDLIESNAQKVGSYSYTTTSGRNNGTWNIEMGYGLLDAYSAVNNTPSPNPTCTNDPTVYIFNHTFSGVEFQEYGCYLEIEDVENINGAVIDYKFLHEAYIKEDFEVELGSEVFIGNCCK
ncbi:MAG: S8 family serine peptidase [Bacteroidetes bacterium]|nr:S8 family serine peptidase [Bacteroidota bacterium]